MPSISCARARASAGVCTPVRPRPTSRSTRMPIVDPAAEAAPDNTPAANRESTPTRTVVVSASSASSAHRSGWTAG